MGTEFLITIDQKLFCSECKGDEFYIQFEVYNNYEVCAQCVKCMNDWEIIYDG